MDKTKGITGDKKRILPISKWKVLGVALKFSVIHTFAGIIDIVIYPFLLWKNFKKHKREINERENPNPTFSS
jgi:hypothetical protein